MRIAVTILLLFAFQTLCGQNVAKLKSDLKKYEAEIASINKQIKVNDKKKTTAAANFRLVSRKIETRTKIIVNLTEQIQDVDKQHDSQSRQTIAMSDQLVRLKILTATLIQKAYLDSRSNTAAIVVGSGVESRAANRNVAGAIYVVKELNDRLLRLSEQTHQIEDKLSKLSTEQQRLSQLVVEKASEVETLQREKQQLAALSKSLNASDAKLEKRREEKQSILRERQRQIAVAIASDKPAVKSEQAENKKFEAEARQFPSPVAGGVVVQQFGKHPNAEQPWIIEFNNGIEIACKPSTTVMSVHEGEVRAVLDYGSDGSTVIVRHGKYFTVYGGLAQVSVTKGSTVKSGQRLGLVNETDHRLHFEIWNWTQVLDPQKWIRL